MKNKISQLLAIAIILSATFLSLTGCGTTNKDSENANEYLTPVRPGIPGKINFWNTYSKCFMYAPAFEFRQVDNAVKYRFTVNSKADGKEQTFESNEPSSSLSSIWEDIPVGYAVLTVHGIDKDGKLLDTAGTRSFYRSAEFKGIETYPKAAMDYKESVRKGLEYMFKKKDYQQWISTGLPDTSNTYYCYISKMGGAAIENMLVYSSLTTGTKSDSALLIAKRAAEFVISVSEPAGTPLEFLPPTYYAKVPNFGRPVNYNNDMMVYPAWVGNLYLDLYDKTKDEKFLNAALKIADTHVKTQSANGTWSLLLDTKTGKAASSTFTIPIVIINLLDRLVTQYGKEQYKETSGKAWQWIMNNPVATFFWEAEFEDVAPRKPFTNLAKDYALDVAGYMLNHVQQNPDYLQKAEEIIRFAEDQFVVWDKPLPISTSWEIKTEQWVFPCALEQYAYYVPVNHSAAEVVAAFQKAYEVTGNPKYLDKATALANTFTIVQDKKTGRYPTYFLLTLPPISWDWDNCASLSLKVMDGFAKMLDNKKAVK